MNIVKSFKNSGPIKSYVHFAITGLAGILIGCLAMNEYNYRVDRQRIEANAHSDAIMGLALDATNKYQDGDKNQEKTLAFLASNGSQVAYLFRISLGRNYAFKDSQISVKKFDQAAIDAVDTHPSDALLLEAMDNLSDADLSWLLNNYTDLFDQTRRSELRAHIDKNEYPYSSARYVLMKSLHSSLTELERSQIQECRNKLDARFEQTRGTDKYWKGFGLCSKSSNYKPYEMSPWGNKPMLERWMESLGIL